MKVMTSTFTLEDEINSKRILKKLEKIGRLCYKSEGKITEDSHLQFLRSKIDAGHESIIEHEFITVNFFTDRGVTHEVVRHRIASYTQESTRYCNYSDEEKFDSEITTISIANAMELCGMTKKLDFRVKAEIFAVWVDAMETAERFYMRMLELGASPQIARGVLPTDLKAEIYVTYNLREWRHFFKMRADKAAHPKLKEISIPLLFTLKKLLPIVFDDISYDIDVAKRLGLIV